jgi:hypothetical protein
MSYGAKRLGDRGAVRFFALLAVGVLVVHHLRYAFARFTAAEQQESASVHSYLPFAAALAGVIVAAAVVLYVRELATAKLDLGRPRRSRSFRELWIAATGLLLASYVFQESVESFAAHEPVSLTQILSTHGGWTVLLLAPAAAAVIAFFARTAELVLERVGRSALPRAASRGVSVAWPPSQLSLQPQLVFLRQVAGRAPPLASA